MRFTLGPKISAGSFNFYSSENPAATVSYLYTQDLDGDGLQELIVAGFETQPNTPDTYDATRVHIYGWNNGNFENITERWLPGGASQVEGVGDVVFGDFNGDGEIDVFLSAYTDMDMAAGAYQLINQGGHFEKYSLGNYTWQHGAVAADINGDGYTDVLTANLGFEPYAFLGSDQGLVQYSYNPAWAHGAGVAVGDFLGDGSVSLIVTDNGGVQDTKLYRLQIDDANHTIDLESVGSLPAPLITPDSGPGIAGSHDVRVEAVDFNQDGLLDAVVFSRADSTGDTTPRYSQVQFLQNQGAGRFEDVTRTVLVGYDADSNISYNPIFADFDGDGNLDIFLSEADWGDGHNSTTILAGTDDGQWVDTGRSQFSDVVSQYGGIGAVLQGPDGWYFASLSHNGRLNVENVDVRAMSFGEDAPTVEVTPDPVIEVVSDPVVESSSSSSSSNNDTATSTRTSDSGSSGSSRTDSAVTVEIPASTISTVSASKGAELVIGTAKSDVMYTNSDSIAGAWNYAMDVGSPGHSGSLRQISLKDMNMSWDVFDGGAGYDILYGTQGDDALFLDDMYSPFVNDTRQARIKNIESIDMGAGNDILDLTSFKYSYGDVSVLGGAGDDVIWTNQGNDTLNGGAGHDILSGGAGSDRFVFDVRADDRDVIMDFESQVDTIALSLDAFDRFQGVSNWRDHVNLGSGMPDDNDYLIYRGGALMYDADGNGPQDPIIIAELLGAPALRFEDLVWI